MRAFVLLFIPIIFASDGPINSTNDDKLETVNNKPSSRIFNVIRFPNELCQATPKNGTCYTSDECAERGGSVDGECALGYGVCCIFNLDCGGKSTDNTTYLQLTTKTSFKASEAACSYTICNTNPKVCRIRFDFTTFQIANPALGLVVADAVTSTLEDHSGGVVGDCRGDIFSITSPGNSGSPVICGYNTDQHMFIDASDQCVTASFAFDTSDTSSSRSYDIQVSQYICGDDMGGPPDCLQYYTATSGTVASFNFPTNLNAIDSTTTHLSNQNYHVCFRRASGKCGLCFVPSITITTAASNVAASQSSFGVSNFLGTNADGTTATFAKSDSEADCKTDFLVVPGGMLANSVTVGTVADGIERFCGRVWTINVIGSGTVATRSVCTTRRPFMIFFRTDGNEAEDSGAVGAQTGATNEQEFFPGGIIGFSLDFNQQISC